MKIYLNREPFYGPWGGGMKTINLLSEKLKSKGHDVVYDLNHKDISVLFVQDPRPNSKGEDYISIKNYSLEKRVKIVHRVGDVGLHSKPELTNLLRMTIPHSDHVTYISDFAKEYLNIDHPSFDVTYIAPVSQFYNKRKTSSTLSNPIKIVTHHWSNNPLKGFDFYSFLDENISSINQNIEFTYIGQVPYGFNFKNSNLIEPQKVDFLSKNIPSFDIYLSASINETGGNHVVEALGSGLPVLYHEQGGGISDYCKNYGISYSSKNDMIHKISLMISEYKSFKKKALTYNSTLEDVVDKYVKLLEDRL